MTTDITVAHEVAAAWVLLKPWLDLKKRGDEVLRTDVAPVCGVTCERMEKRIRRYLQDQFKCPPFTLIGKGWRIPLDDEQVDSGVQKHHGRARKENRIALAAAYGANPMTDQGKRLKSHAVKHLGEQAARDEAANIEIKTILGAPPPRPQLKSVKE